MPRDPEVQDLLDKQALHELNARWARSIDRGDEDMFLSCYHDGAVERHGPFSGSPAEFVEKLFPLLRSARCYHYITNELYRIAGDRAVGEIYCPTFYDAMLDDPRATKRSPTGRRRSSAGRYLDRYERRDGRWGIVERLVTVEWPSLDGGDGGGFVVGRQDRSDPMYSLGL